LTGKEYFYMGAHPRDPRRLFWAPLQDRLAHVAVWGASGTGKSHLLFDFLGQDIMAGRGCGLVDPKGDLFQDVLAALTASPEDAWRKIADDLIIIDPADPACTTSFNPLEISSYASPSRQRAEIVSIFHKIWDLDDAKAPRLGLVIRRGVQLAMDNALTLCELPRLLTDGELRERLLDRSPDEALRRFWRQEFPTAQSAQIQWTGSTLTRLETLLDDPAVRRLVGRSSSFDFRRAMDEGKVVLINLAKGRLGQETAYLLGGFLLAKIQMAAESRQDIFPPESRKTFFLAVDEMQNYVTKSFEEMLAEARGYGISVTMANQHLGQLDDGLRQAVLSNCRIRIAFRLSLRDAAIVAPELWRFAGDRVAETRWGTASFGKLHIPIPEAVYHSVGDESRQNKEALHYLPDRHMWVHIQGEGSPTLLRSVEMPRDRLLRARPLVPRLKALAYPAPTAQIAGPSDRLELSTTNGRGTYDWAGPAGGPSRPRQG
jgi:hypothetical protein